MSEAIIERAFLISAVCDEVVPHEATLEGAAAFLAHGDGEAFKGPQAKSGDTVMLEVLEQYADRVATFDADANAWMLDPPPPADADLFAVRYAPGGGWDAESIAGSVKDFSEVLSSYADDEEDEICDIAVARTRNVEAVFEIRLGKPLLIIKQVRGQPTSAACSVNPDVIRAGRAS